MAKILANAANEKKPAKGSPPSIQAVMEERVNSGVSSTRWSRL
jgi:hypothetical protein